VDLLLIHPNRKRIDFSGGDSVLRVQMKNFEVLFVLWSISTRRLSEDGDYTVVGASLRYFRWILSLERYKSGKN
jgi:hypothetical protein